MSLYCLSIIQINHKNKTTFLNKHLLFLYYFIAFGPRPSGRVEFWPLREVVWAPSVLRYAHKNQAFFMPGFTSAELGSQREGERERRGKHKHPLFSFILMEECCQILSECSALPLLTVGVQRNEDPPTPPHPLPPPSTTRFFVKLQSLNPQIIFSSQTKLLLNALVTMQFPRLL